MTSNNSYDVIRALHFQKTMVRNYKPKGSTSYKKVDSHILKQATEDVANKKMSLRQAAAHYGISYSVIYRHAKKGNSIKPQGGQTCLSESDEALLVQRLKLCSEWGYPVDTWMLRLIVQEYLDRTGKKITKFKRNLPGPDFVYSFLRRHKRELSYRMCQNIKRNRCAVSNKIVNEYFDRLHKELQDVPASNIVNYDETNLCDDPGKKKVITRRGCKYPERVMNSTKASVSVMFSAAGNGTILPPYVVYKALHLYNSWTEGGPQHARYNRSKSGWFDCSSFEDWLSTIAIPYLKKQTGKRVLIGDNLASHLTLKVIELCSDNDISLIFLPANSTHLTQPLDVAFFRPLKTAWRKILEKWKLSQGKYEASLPKDRFPRLLKQLMDDIKNQGPKNVRAGFRKCGIVPLDRSPVLRMLPTVPNPGDGQKFDESLISLLRDARYGPTQASTTREKRSKIQVLPGQSVTGSANIVSEDPEPAEMIDAPPIPSNLNKENVRTYPFVKFTYSK